MRYNRTNERLRSSVENVKLWTLKTLLVPLSTKGRKAFSDVIESSAPLECVKWQPRSLRISRTAEAKPLQTTLVCCREFAVGKLFVRAKELSTGKIQQQRQAHENVFHSAGEIIKVLTTLFNSLGSSRSCREEEFQTIRVFGKLFQKTIIPLELEFIRNAR